MDEKIKILGFGGSLRKGSFNQTLLEAGCMLEAAPGVCPENATFEIFDQLGDCPLYSQELEKEMPNVVKEFTK